MMDTLTVEQIPTANLATFKGNPRRGDVTAIARSLTTNGQYRAIVVNRGTHTGRPMEVLAGNHTLMAARDLGWETIAAHIVDVDEDRARRIVLADNRTADLGDYDNRALVDILQGLPNLDGTGYNDDDLDELLNSPTPDEGEDERAATTGEILSMIDVTMDDPQQEVDYGEVWQVGRHTLIVAKLLTEWEQWVEYLRPGVHFCPYPDPYLTVSDVARTEPMLLVQPSTYLAGHLIDKHRSAFPDETVERIA